MGRMFLPKHDYCMKVHVYDVPGFYKGEISIFNVIQDNRVTIFSILHKSMSCSILYFWGHISCSINFVLDSTHLIAMKDLQ